MQLSPIITAIPNSPQDGAALSSENFRPGDRLLGRVLRLEADGRTLIDLGRFRAKAQIGFPAQPGQTIHLQVIKGGAPLQLKAELKLTPQAPADLPQLNFSKVLSAGDQQKLVSVLDRLFQNPQLVSPGHQMAKRYEAAISQVKALFDTIPVDRPMTQLVEWLKGAVEDRGILFEKRLAEVMLKGSFTPPEGSGRNQSKSQVRSIIAKDIKPNLIILKALLEGGDILRTAPEIVSKNDIGFLQGSVSKLLKHIVQQQERAISNWREGDSFQVFTHMLPFEKQTLPVQIKIHYPKKKRGGENTGSHHRIALLLQMDRLGSVRVDLAMAEQHLKIQIFVKNDEIRQRFEGQSQGVTNALKGVFDGVVLVTAVSEEKIAQFNQPGKRGVSLGRIDLQA